MDLAEFADMPLIDCHVHLGHFGPGGTEVTADDLQKSSEFMVETIKKGSLSQMYITGHDAGLYLKAKYPRLFYAGGFAPWSGETMTVPIVDWHSYVTSLLEVGFDGVGEMGSKPVPRVVHTPLDSSYYNGFWEACESLDFPVLCHVADPEEFWDEYLAPNWAKEQGWVYYAGDYPTKEELYREIENVLSAHPRVKVVFCHFYFMSADLERASDFLNSYRNANFDVTPGIELMYNISRRRDDWRDFFIKHQDRIFFGTDIATWQTIQESVDRIWLIRNLLESDERFFTPLTADKLLTRYKEPFVGLNLPKCILKKMYAENFKRLWGKEPRKIDSRLAIRMCDEKNEKAIADALRKISAFGQ